MRKFVIAIEITVPDTVTPFAPCKCGDSDCDAVDEQDDIDLSGDDPAKYDWSYHIVDLDRASGAEAEHTRFHLPCALLSCQEIPCTTTPSPAPSSSSATV
jgi:hypothetical protein